MAMKKKSSPARKSDPKTSHDAAESQRPFSQKILLLEAFAWAESTDEEAAERAVGVNMRSCWWKRCSELREEGLIEWVTNEEGLILTRTGQLGAQQGISQITAKGFRTLGEL